MTRGWTKSATSYRLGLTVIVILVCVLGLHMVIWRPIDHSIEVLQQEVDRLDQESQGLIQQIGSLKVLERDISALREILSSQVQQFPKDIRSETFRMDVVDIAKKRNVMVRMWKPEVPLRGLQNTETSIPITIKVEGNFSSSVQFLDELRDLLWVQSIASIVMAKKQGSEESSLVVTSIAIHGLTPLSIEHVQKLLKA